MTEKCSVLGGEFALLMQGGLFFVTCSVLVWKKYVENGDRTWFEFGLDSSKQIAGAGWAHAANLLCAVIFAEELTGVDGCTWYAANIIIDTTLGVGVEYALLEGVKWLLKRFEFKAAEELLEQGSYWGKGVRNSEREFRFANYACQLVEWLFIVTLMKISMVALMQTFPVLIYAINALFNSLAHMPRVKLFVVMICIPMMMNTFQFVITDNFIKKKPRQETSSSFMALSESERERCNPRLVEEDPQQADYLCCGTSKVKSPKHLFGFGSPTTPYENLPS